MDYIEKILKEVNTNLFICQLSENQQNNIRKNLSHIEGLNVNNIMCDRVNNLENLLY